MKLNKMTFESYKARNNSPVIMTLLLVSFGLLISGCGGGSSGTGADGLSRGQVVDGACKPLADVDMPSLGVDTSEQTSASDGRFVLSSTKPQTIPDPTNGSGSGREISEPSCVIIVYEDGIITSSVAYPLADLSDCSIEEVQSTYPQNELPGCDSLKQ
jgi:hypothetical protein